MSWSPSCHFPWFCYLIVRFLSFLIQILWNSCPCISFSRAKKNLGSLDLTAPHPQNAALSLRTSSTCHPRRQMTKLSCREYLNQVYQDIKWQGHSLSHCALWCSQNISDQAEMAWSWSVLSRGRMRGGRSLRPAKPMDPTNNLGDGLSSLLFVSLAFHPISILERQ